jgi:hypothetical protein
LYIIVCVCVCIYIYIHIYIYIYTHTHTCRYEILIIELRNRGYDIKPDARAVDFSQLDKFPQVDAWKPDDAAVAINRQRLHERISAKPEWYRFRGQRVDMSAVDSTLTCIDSQSESGSGSESSGVDLRASVDVHAVDISFKSRDSESDSLANDMRKENIVDVHAFETSLTQRDSESESLGNDTGKENKVSHSFEDTMLLHKTDFSMDTLSHTNANKKRTRRPRNESTDG